jgi:hypothetical protein
MSANVKDRHSIIASYPFEQFESDGNQNSIATATTRHGLLVESAPDRDGSFRLRRVTKSIGDGHEGPEALFICPYLGRAYEFSMNTMYSSTRLSLRSRPSGRRGPLT